MLRSVSRHRIYCPTALAPDSTVTLDGPQAHYLGHVLRVKAGDSITLFDGSGVQFQAEVITVEKKRVELETSEARSVDTESPLLVTLIQSVIRGERMDFCVQKATELGVHAIAPVFTERSVVKIPQNRLVKRTDHWRKIAVSACEQSGRVRVPEVHSPLTLEDAVTKSLATNTVLLALDPWSESRPLHTITPPESASIAICIGPEGGFSPNEIEFLRKSGAVSVTCGPRVLRSETAGIVAVAACQMLFGDWS